MSKITVKSKINCVTIYNRFSWVSNKYFETMHYFPQRCVNVLILNCYVQLLLVIVQSTYWRFFVKSYVLFCLQFGF